jgi:hypothetical protein
MPPNTPGADASCKTAFVIALLDELVTKGHRVLVFSQSRVMLDILQVGPCFPFQLWSKLGQTH